MLQIIGLIVAAVGIGRILQETCLFLFQDNVGWQKKLCGGLFVAVSALACFAAGVLALMLLFSGASVSR